MINLTLTNELCHAVRCGNVAEIRRIFGAGADPNQSNHQGWTPLRYASDRGSAEAIRVLLELGADIHRGARFDNDLTYLHHAAMSGSADSVRVLLAAGSDPEARNQVGQTVFHCAAKSNIEPGAVPFVDTNIRRIVTMLIKAGANPCATDDHEVTPLHRAAENANAGLMQLLFEHGSDPYATDVNGFTPLHYAVCTRSRPETMSEAVAVLLDAGANADVAASAQRFGRGATPLLLAASHAPVAVVKQLLAAGANPDFVDKKKRLPLIEAIGNADNFAALLAAGADSSPLLKTTGKPFLLLAAEKGNAPAVKALLAANADPNKMYRGKSPLHAAVAKASPDAIVTLLVAGADHLLPDKAAMTALDIARKRRRKAILPLLEAAEAKRLANNISSVH